MSEGRIPYPLDGNGIPLKPIGLNECYDVCLNGGKSQNRHHLGFERKNYKTPPERGYRDSASMIVKACICKHADLHSTYLPPKKPSTAVMYDVIQGDIVPTEAVVFIRSKEQINQENVA